MTSRRFAPRALMRRPGIELPRQGGILVCYDGEKTEEDYFRGWKKALGTRGTMVSPYYVRSGGNAFDAVKETVKIMERDRDYDEIWCVCDADDTSGADMESAKSLALASGISIALSTRCFEVWVALHWPNVSTAPVTGERDARRLVARHYKNYARGPKIVPFSLLYEKTDVAIDNARWLKAQGHINPSTNVHELVEKLRAMNV